MKVYVSELPKCCENCQFTRINLGGFTICKFSENKIKGCSELAIKSCPLQSLSDYTKQVRKEVCEKFVEEFMIEYTMGNEPVEDIIYKVSDRIQGE